MKKIISTLALVIGIIWQLQAQVSGFAYLNGQTNHSGIKVKFIAKSPSAKTDSTFTNVDGSYSKSLQAGAYSIRFTQNNFDTINYNQGSILLINSQISLNSQTLIKTFILIPLSGNIKGVLKANTTYKVISDITITDTLYIEAGATIIADSLFIPSKNIFISGVFKAIGNNANKILFKNLTIYPNKIATVELDNCILNNTQVYNPDTENKSGYFRMENSELFNTKTDGINYCCDSIIFKNNYIHDISINSNGHIITYCCAVSLKAYKKSVVSCNKIVNCYNRGLNFSSESIQSSICENNYLNNIFTNRNVSEMSIGMSVSGSSLICRNNIVKNVDIGILTFEGHYFNNIISNTKHAFNSNFDYKNLKIYSNLLTNNLLGLFVNQASNNTDISVIFTNNLVYNNSYFSNVYVNIYGVPFSTNQNGDSVDAYNNIIANPQFLNSNQVSYKSGSPIYGAGLNGTNIGFDPKGTCLENEWFLGSIDTLTLSGTVHQSTSFLKNGKVIAYNIDKNTFKETITDANGNFTFDSLAIGNYVIKAIPNNGENFLTTFFPNKSDSLSAVKINLDADITSVDIFMNSITGIDNTIGGGVITKPNPFENQLFVKVLENTSTGIQASISNAVGDIIRVC